MAKPRKPTNVLALKGAFRANPSRAKERSNEPSPVGDIGPPPEYLSPAVAAAWTALVTHAHAGTLCASDREFMEYAAKIWAEIKASETVDPKLGIRFEACIAKLGMSPADRSRVSVIKPKEQQNSYTEFASG